MNAQDTIISDPLPEGESVHFQKWEQGTQHCRVVAVHRWPTGYQTLVMSVPMFERLGGKLPQGYTGGRRSRRKPPIKRK